MRKSIIWALSICLVFIGSCVTVNIYFPAAAAQKAADTIIEDIQGQDKGPANEPQNQPAPQKPQNGDKSSRLEFPGIKISFGPSEAYAAEPDLDISTPAITAIRASLKNRYQQQLAPYFDSGVIGMSNNGLIAVHDASSLSLKDRANVNNLVNQQNADLMNLYKEIAKANHLAADAVPKLQKTFSDRWHAKAKPGRWIQNDNGSWTQRK
jgi:uncharacterized protein YdbL (DUF1318 family)